MKPLLLFTTLLLSILSTKGNAQCTVTALPVMAYGGPATYNVPPGGNLGPFQVCNGAVVYDTMLTTQRTWFLQAGSILYLKNAYNHTVYMKGNSTLYNLGGAGNITVYKEALSVVYGIPAATSCATVGFSSTTCPVPDVTGVEEHFTEREISLYPNPAVNYMIAENNTNTLLQLSISNVLGCETRQFILGPGKTEVDLSGLSNGFYFVRISGNGKKPLDKKIIVSH